MASLLKTFFYFILGASLFLISFDGSAQTVETFNAPGTFTFTVPCNVTSLQVECWGAGGGSGGGTNNTLPGGSGGGGGAYASSTFTVTSGQTFQYVIGAGGPPSAGSGGPSTFATNTVIAMPGTSGADNGGALGTGGSAVASTGTVKFGGGDGFQQLGGTDGGGGGGAGGSSTPGGFGSGTTGGIGGAIGGGNGGNGQPVGVDGQTGFPPGGGAGGSGRRAGGSESGMSGADGQIKITYTQNPLSGTYSIGPTGDFLSITASIIALQCVPITGPVIFELQSAYTDLSETFPLTFTSISGASAVNTITYRPAAGANSLVISNANGVTLFDIDGGDFLIFDGRPGGAGVLDANSMTIRNTKTVAPIGSVFDFLNDASNNKLVYLYIEGEANAFGLIELAGTTNSTGNDNNEIRNSKISDLTIGGTVNKPKWGVKCIGTGGKPNSNIIVDNCEFVDIFFPDANISAAILINNDGDGWLITNNHVYQTSNDASLTFYWCGISLISGSNHLVDGNYVGGTAPFCGGTPFIVTSGVGVLNGINTIASSGESGVISNNTIANIQYTTTHTLSAYAPLGPIVVEGAADWIVGGVGNGNTIGTTSGTGNIILTNNSATGVKGIYAIENRSSGIVEISDNKIGALTLNGTRDLAVTKLIENSAGTTTILNNILGNSTANNILVSSSSTLYGIDNSSVNGIVITNNTIQQINSTNTGASAVVYGIYNTNGVLSAAGNTIRDINVASSWPATIVNLGIVSTSTSTSHLLTKNTIQNLHTTNAGATTNSSMGILVQGAGSSGSVTKNFISGLTNQSSTSSSDITGIQVQNGNWNVNNNVVMLDNAPYTNDLAVYGIQENETAGITNIYHNTVKVFGSVPGGGTSPSTCFFRAGAGTSTDNVINNIFLNLRTGGTGGHNAERALAGGTYATNYNYLEVLDNAAKLGNLGGTNYDFANWKGVTGAANDLNGTIALDGIGKVSTNPFIGAGTGKNLIATVVDDKVDVLRAAAPWVGAYEGQNITTGTISPLSYCAGTAVSVPYTIGGSGSFNGGNIFTAELSDALGDFSAPTNIGTLASTTSGTIAATIPGPTPTGSWYRIRVVASNPAVIGADNGGNIIINTGAPIPPVAASANNITCSSFTAFRSDSIAWSSGPIAVPLADLTKSLCEGQSSIIIPAEPSTWAGSDITVGLDVTGDPTCFSVRLFTPFAEVLSLTWGEIVSGWVNPNCTFNDAGTYALWSSAGATNTSSFKAQGDLNFWCASTPNITTFGAINGGVPTNMGGTWNLEVERGACAIGVATFNSWYISVPNTTTTYYLDVATDAGFSSLVPGYNNLNIGTAANYNVTGLLAGTNYYYRFRAENVCGTSANSNAIGPVLTTGTSQTFVVTNTGNTGAGSLRQAILDANANCGHDLIKFNLGAGGPFTISLSTALPSLTDNDGATIDGWDNSGNDGTPNTIPVFNATGGTPLNPVYKIILGNAGTIPTGLTLASDNNVIQGLVLQNFGDGTPSNNDVQITISGNDNKILGCNIGMDATGTTKGTNNYVGVSISGVDNLIGDGTATGANLISGMNNSGVGVYINGASTTGNLVKGNMIGLQKDGSSFVFGSIQIIGVRIDGSAVSNTIGGSVAGEGNVISGNSDGAAGGVGIYIFTNPGVGNSIKGNIIGPRADGVGFVTSNKQGSGINISSSPNNTIGGNTVGERNIISANESEGIVILGATSIGNTIKGNYIGINKNGTAIIAGSTQNFGVNIGTSSGDGNILGGTGASEGNLISGNTSAGVYLNSSAATGNTILGNTIGPQADRVTYLTSNAQLFGVRIINSLNNVVGGNTAGARNIISANETSGVYIAGASSTGNIVKGNYIGPSFSLATIPGSSQDYGVYVLSSAANNKIGTGLANEENQIAFNTVEGVYLTSLAATGNLVSGNPIYNNSGKPINLNYGAAQANSGKAVPLITTVNTSTVIGTSGASDVIEVFKNTTTDCFDATTFIGSTTADGSGNWSLGVTLLVGDYVLATATDASNNTSEFSGCFTLSNSISTDAIAPTTLCRGGNITVTYTITGTFVGGNIFTAELSDEFGSFTTPTSVGSIAATVATPISATIPVGSNPGTLYRIRVVSSNPIVIGTDNGSNLTVPVDGGVGTWTWQGTISSNWFDRCNWDLKSLPDVFSLVTIPNGTPNDPLITGANANCKRVTIQSTTGARLNIDSSGGWKLNITP